MMIKDHPGCGASTGILVTYDVGHEVSAGGRMGWAQSPLPSQVAGNLPALLPDPSPLAALWDSSSSTLALACPGRPLWTPHPKPPANVLNGSR